MPEQTPLTFFAHGKVKNAMRLDGSDAEAVLAQFTRGIDYDALAAEQQRDGAKAFATSWSDLMAQIACRP